MKGIKETRKERVKNKSIRCKIRKTKGRNYQCVLKKTPAKPVYLKVFCPLTNTVRLMRAQEKITVPEERTQCNFPMCNTQDGSVSVLGKENTLYIDRYRNNQDEQLTFP